MQIEDSPLGGITYARFFPSDWRSGCFMLNLEEEGLYIRCCAWMYDTGQPIPGNDLVAAKLLHVQVQKYAKVMQSLIDKGKMIRAQGVVINKRCFDEIDKYRQQQAARSVAAKKREEDRRKRLEQQATDVIMGARNGGTPPPTPQATPLPTPPPTWGGSPTPTPTTTPPRSIEGDAEKLNENNGTEAQPLQTLSRPCPQAGKPESRSQNPEEEKKERRETARGDDWGAAYAAAPPPFDFDEPECADDPPKDTLSVDVYEAFRLYNDLAQRIGLQMARTLTPQRRKDLIARLREHGGLSAWMTALANVERSAFLRGKNDRNWRCHLDFLLAARSFAKVVDGSYGNGAHGDMLRPAESEEARARRRREYQEEVELVRRQFEGS